MAGFESDCLAALHRPPSSPTGTQTSKPAASEQGSLVAHGDKTPANADYIDRSEPPSSFLIALLCSTGFYGSTGSAGLLMVLLVLLDRP